MASIVAEVAMDDELRERIEGLVRAHASGLPEATRAPLTAAVLHLVEREVATVRERAVALCLRRGELWRETSLRPGRPREEARARSNEAFYLADMLELGQDFPADEPPSHGSAGGGIEARGAS